MITLAIETATAACSVALIDGDRVLARAHEVVGRGHAERLLPMIRDCLAGQSTPEAILVDCGPGSFTGVRVGIAAARALAMAWGVPIRGFSSMALLAAMADTDRVAVALIGGHGELFVQSFHHNLPSAPLRSLPPTEAAAAIEEHLVVGSAAEALVAARGHGEPRELLPDAAETRHLATDLATLPPTPIYGRAPDAKVPA